MGNSGQQRAAVTDDEGGPGEEGDGLYDEVDSWDMHQDKLLLQATAAAGGRRKGSSGHQREVFALSGTDSDSDFDLPPVNRHKEKKKKKTKEDQEEIEGDEGGLADSDVEDGGGEGRDELRAWGSKKKHFYGGNTGERVRAGDSDSSFDEDEAEEREAALLQQRQLDQIQEEDFIDTFTLPPPQPGDKKVEEAEVVEEAVKRDLSSLSQKELLALFRQTSPEFDGIVLDFKAKMGEAVRLSRVVSLQDDGSIPPGPVATFVREKFQLLLNYCTNIICYMMFKAKGTNLKLHPVTARLVQYKQIIDSLVPLDELVMGQVDQLLEQLDQGTSLQEAIRQERRRVKKSMDRAASKLKKLKILDKKSEVPPSQPVKEKEKKKNKRKLEPEHLDTLTGDERMAVELYQAIKKGRRDITEEEEPEEESKIPENTYNNKGDALADAEEEKRAITYQIAKNKGLTPKRNKLQRNPRVKNRVKFEKAKKRRKGAVREVRTETTRYSGEQFGINARVKKGVKIK